MDWLASKQNQQFKKSSKFETKLQGSMTAKMILDSEEKQNRNDWSLKKTLRL